MGFSLGAWEVREQEMSPPRRPFKGLLALFFVNGKASGMGNTLNHSKRVGHPLWTRTKAF